MQTAYYGNWLLLPKTRFNIPSLMNALTYPLRSRDRITGFVHAYKEDETYFYAPREFYTEQFLQRLNIDLKYQLPEKYPKVRFSDGILLDALDPASNMQRKAFAALKSTGHGVLSLACGKGKTVVALKYAAALRRPVLVIVETTALVTQWAVEAQEKLGVKDSQIGRIQGPPASWTADRPFVLATIQSLALHADSLSESLCERFGLVIWDECVHGDAVIETDEGPLTMREVVSGRATQALSYNEKTGSWEYRKITRRYSNGVKSTVAVYTSGGTVRVTPDHLFRSTSGWVKAKDLKPGEQILSPALVDAGLEFQQRLHEVGPELTSQVMVDASVSGPLPRQNSAASMGRCLETARSYIRISELGLQESPSTMALFKRGGCAARQRSSLRYGFESAFGRMVVSGRRIAEATRSAIHSLWTFLTWSVLEEEPRSSLVTGLTASLPRGWHGGTWTTALGSRKGASVSTPSPSVPKRSAPSEGGSETLDIRQPRITTRESSSCSTPIQVAGSLVQPVNTVPLAWSTNSVRVREVRPSLATSVYDLEIEEVHNYVADGHLVHNCHHLSAPHYNKTAALFPGLRLGLSATPERSDGLEGLYLVHMGNIFYLDHTQDLVPAVDFHEVDLGVDWGSEAVLDEILDRTGELSWTRLWGYLGNSQKYVDEAVDLVLKAASQGRKILVLSSRLHTVKKVNDALNASQGGLSDVITSKTKQEGRIHLLRNSQVTVAITRIAREGLDEPSLDTLVMMEPTSDANILRQTVGRILRSCATKKHPEVHVMVAKTDPCIRMMYAMRKNFNSWPRKPKMRFHK